MDNLNLRFEIAQKEVLNANSLPNHFIVKGKMSAALRARGAERGLEIHPDVDSATKRLEAIRKEEELKVLKSRARKALKKEKATEEEILEKFESIEREFGNFTPSKEIAVEFPFTQFRVDVTIHPPTRRRFDPPNLYPTVKHLIDGMTDASLWKDDSFDQLVEMSFRSGECSGISKTFVVALNITEVGD